MTNILLVHWGRTAAGPSLTLRLAQALIADGRHQVAVSYSSDADVVEDFRRLPCERLEVSTWRSPRDIPRTLLQLPNTIRRLSRFMDQQRITHTVVPMEHPLQAMVSWLFASRGRHYIHFMHDATLHPGERSALIGALRRLHLRPADDVVVFSGAVRDAAVREWGLQRDHVHVTQLPPMFAAEGMAPARSLPLDRPIVCGMFGRAVEYKGFDLAVEAVAMLRAKGHDVRLQLIGAGVTGFVPKAHRGADWLEVEDRWITDGEIPAILGGLDLLLLPYTEASQSGVLAEAGSLGVPSVVTPVGGLPEQAQAMNCGDVAASVDAPGVADAVERLLTDGDRYAALSRGGAQWGSAGRQWSKLLGDLEPLVSCSA